MAGRGDAVDGVGFISRIRADGTMDKAEWITGFDAPKGLALIGDRLFASDITFMIEIDVAQAALLRRTAVLGANYLNDVTADPQGRVYVSDARGHGLYRIDPAMPFEWVRNPDIIRPNGLRVINNRMLVLSGAQQGEGEPGDRRRLAWLDLTGANLTEFPVDRGHFGHADGIEPDGRGGYFLSTNASGEVIHITPSGQTKTVAKLTTNATDLHFAPATGLLYVPSASGHSLTAFAIAWD
jgi:sugar lactone lactonase YvrE